MMFTSPSRKFSSLSLLHHFSLVSMVISIPKADEAPSEAPRKRLTSVSRLATPASSITSCQFRQMEFVEHACDKHHAPTERKKKKRAKESKPPTSPSVLFFSFLRACLFSLGLHRKDLVRKKETTVTCN